MATYYVSPTVGNNTNAGTKAAPFRTIAKAVSVVQPGDEVIALPGTYAGSLTFNRGGSALGGYVTFKAETPGTALVRPPATAWNGINISANYIRIEGFDISGAKGDGIEANGVHHVQIVNNIISNCGESGIQTNYGDYFLIEGNTCYKNASTGWFSGISLYQNRNITGDTDNVIFRNVIRGNICYDNVTVSGYHTDGNGIIIDDFRSTQNTAFAPYLFPTLVENNICYQNGGKGIQVTWSDNVTVRNNIAWKNNRDNLNEGTWRGELSNSQSSNNTWIGNIAVVDTSINPNNTAIDNTSYDNYTNTNVLWRNNTTFTGVAGQASVRLDGGNSLPPAADNKLGVDPKFKNPPTDFSVEVAPPPPPPPPPDPDPEPEVPVEKSTFLSGLALGVIVASMEKELLEDIDTLTVAQVKEKVKKWLDFL